MAIVTTRTDLNQGSSLGVSDAVFATSAGIATNLTATTLPAWEVGEFLEIRDHSLSSNNGLYVVDVINTTTTDYDISKVSGSDPQDSGSEAIITLGATGTSTEKSVFFDTAGLGAYILEQGNVNDLTDGEIGVTGQAFYSFAMQEWKDDNFLIANAPFPLLTIDADAGKFLIGQNASGNNSGWAWVDDSTNSIRTRKMLRNMGWDEITSTGITSARYIGVVTLGVFEDNAADTAYYFFGSDTIVDNTQDFDFPGPVNEAVQFYDLIGDLSGDTPSFASTTTIIRSTGSFVTDGFVVGGQISVTGSSTNDGTYTLTVVTATSMTISTTWTAEAWGTTQIAVDNDNAMTLGLRIRDADPNGKTFAQANLSTAGKTILGNFVYSFPLANATDLKISATDATIIGTEPYVDTAFLTLSDGDVTADSPTFTSATGGFTAGMVGELICITTGPNAGMYEIVTHTDTNNVDVDRDFGTTEGPTIAFTQRPYGMSITYHSSGQSRSNLVGGPFDFSIIVEANNGTSTEIYEYIQYQLRQSSDIDADASTAIGRAMDLLCRFNGEILELGSADGGLNFPYNPDSSAQGGVYADNIHSSSANNVRFWDDTGAALRSAPETIAVTLDFNSTAIDDTTTEYDLFYDRTIRTTVADLIITGTTDTFDSAGANLPTTGDVGDYVRISGLTGGDAAMNGVYQVLTETSTSQWDVIRYDGQTIVTTSEASVSLDENCVDTPDAIIVHTNVVNTESGSTITYTAPDTVTDSADGFALTSGDRIQIEGSTSNDGIYTVDTAAIGELTLIEQTIGSEASSTSSVISQIVSGLAASDYTFSYDFDGNVQGGRTVSIDTFVQAKAIGSTTSQYTESTVQTIESGTPLTIPVVAQIERNYA